MPKLSNRAALGNRLARRASRNEQRRSDLLAEILEESSSISLNDITAETSARQVIDSHSKLLDLIDELKQIESDLNPQLPSRNEETITSFFSWVDRCLSVQDGPKLSERVGIVPLSAVAEYNIVDKKEYALIAKVPYKKGENIFSINRKVMLSSETAMKDIDLGDFIKKDSIASGMQNVVLVLHLLNEYSKKDKSYWWPYLSVLPTRILPVLALNKESLKCLSASTHIFEALKMIRAIARQYSYFFKRLQSTNLPLSKCITYDYYTWGVSIVCSRQNEIPASNKRSSPTNVAHALIPLLDMCNHDVSSNQATFETDNSLLLASKDLEISNEITINYGCRSSGEFYIHNGFVPEEVPSDVLPITIVLNKQDNLYESKAKLLKILNMPTFGRFRLTRNDHASRHKRDPHLTMFLIVHFLMKEELDFILSANNPVGVADIIYEYVQYGKNDNKDVTSPQNNHTTSCCNGVQEKESDKLVIDDMKDRLSKIITQYLSKRASIGIALIDRTLSDVKSLDPYATALLKHEKSIYESYTKTESAD